MSKKVSFRDFLELAALSFVLYLLIQFALGHFFPDQFGDTASQTGIFVEMQDSTVKGGHHPIVTVRNKTDEPLVLTNRCPMPPVSIEYFDGDAFAEKVTRDTALPCETFEPIGAGESQTIDLGPWKYSLFSDLGQYRLSVEIEKGNEEAVAALEKTEFSIHEAGWFTRVFRTFVSKPLLNLLVFIASLLPDQNLGLAVILLTIIVKIVLYFPTKKGLESQKALQAVQPKLEAVKNKHKDDPKKMQEETMRIWKEHKVNPVGSCLPMLIQFPVLIGLFFVVRDGAVLELSTHLLYEFHQNLPWAFGTNFLGMDLKESNGYIMAPLLMVLQFYQMRLSFANAEKKKAEKGEKEKKKDDGPDAQAMQKKMMMYGLPIMIGVFAFQFPAAVSLYWLVSTIFAIGQQVVVNKGK